MGLSLFRRTLIVAALLLSATTLIDVCTAVRDMKYYDLLGIAPDADERTIQKAYRRAAL